MTLDNKLNIKKFSMSNRSKLYNFKLKHLKMIKILFKNL